MNVLKRKLPLGAVAFAIVLVLAAMGLVYGNWSQTLSIGGTVTTGSVSAEFELPDLAGPNPICVDNEETRGVKEFGSTRQDAQGKTLTVTIDNAYPNYAGNCEWHIRYTGQTPGVIEAINFDDKQLTNCRYPDLFTPQGVSIPNPDNIGAFATGSFTRACDALVVQWVNSLCTPMQNGALIGGSIIVTVAKDANDVGPEMKTKYAFNITLDVVQFDKTTC